VIFAGYTHTPAVSLCENLGKLLPETLQRYFFSDNGSTAVEVALKMAFQYWRNLGNSKRMHFICLEGGYHGDTFGAMTVGQSSGFHNSFLDALSRVFAIPFPATWDKDLDVDRKESSSLGALKSYLEIHGDEIVAIILEPLVQGASGMRMARPVFFEKVIKLVRSYDILVIFDEVMTGFGRTGTNFALQQICEVPDFVCLSKGLTGGFLPLALTVTTERVYSAFLSNEWRYAFAHGHSYTANPIACAAAVASLEILERPETKAALSSLSDAHRKGLDYLQSRCDFVRCTRVKGAISAFELILREPDSSKKMASLKYKFQEAGLILRPLGNTVYLLPPYCTTLIDLENSYAKIARILEEI
jgi:adenosylmethionine-8-amino-7-oxononanoate aminotransferase